MCLFCGFPSHIINTFIHTDALSQWIWSVNLFNSCFDFVMLLFAWPFHLTSTRDWSFSWKASHSLQTVAVSALLHFGKVLKSEMNQTSWRCYVRYRDLTYLCHRLDFYPTTPFCPHYPLILLSLSHCPSFHYPSIVHCSSSPLSSLHCPLSYNTFPLSFHCLHCLVLSLSTIIKLSYCTYYTLSLLIYIL